MDFLLILMILTPITLAILARFTTHLGRRQLHLITIGAILQVLYTFLCAGPFDIPEFAFGQFFMLDRLSFFFLILLTIVYAASSFSTWFFFREDLDYKTYPLPRFIVLWQLTLASMLFVLFSNHIALIWVGIESTTLFTTFLILDPHQKTSLEALWKYLIICTVGVAFALIGTIFIGLAASQSGDHSSSVFFWSSLKQNASMLNTTLMKLGIVFLFIGYATKAGVAPMHTWVPDTYNVAPDPVVSLFAGFVSSLAIYVLMRFVPIFNMSNPGLLENIFLGFGLFSLVLATVFILFQKNLKRLLAYSSLENMGVILIALSLGKTGHLVALLHTFYHALIKNFAFTVVGRVGAIYKGHNISSISRLVDASPLWAFAFAMSFLGLMGLPPMPIFFSKYLMIKNLVFDPATSWWLIAIVLISFTIIFSKFLQYMIGLIWGNANDKNAPPSLPLQKEHLVFVLPFIILFLIIGLFIPSAVFSWVEKVSTILAGG